MTDGPMPNSPLPDGAAVERPVPGRVLVLGSLNVDSTSYVDDFPAPGETVTSTGYVVALGGKGSNQAVAVARSGVAVDLVARVGADAAGAFARAELRRLGLDISRVREIEDAATGVAQITVAAGGENTVIVSPGANATLAAQDVADVFDEADTDPAAIALTVAEVPAPAIAALAEACSRAGIRFVLNLAPPGALPERVIATCDPLVVNEHEAAAIGIRPSSADPSSAAPADADPADADGARAPDAGAWERAAVEAVGSGRCRSLVVTLGAAGAVVADSTGGRAIHAPRAEAVDTTGAGDCFTGTLAAFLAEGRPLADAVGLGVAAATLSVQARGTVDSYADREAVLRFAEQNGLA